VMDEGKQSRLFEHGFSACGPRVFRERAPVNAVCFYCGQERLLSWVVDERHVCGECKREMSGEKK